MAAEPNPANETLVDDLSALPAVTDRIRVAALNLAQQITAARTGGFTVEVARSTARHGADSPVVQILQRRLESQQALAVQIQAERQRASVEAVAPKPGVLILHGLVFAEGIGIARVTVSAVDSEGNHLVFVCSDERGYFKLEIIDERNKPNTPLQVFLLVSDQGQAVLFQGDEAFEFKPGTVVYREIMIGDFRREPCPEPPKVEILIVPNLDGLTQSAAEAALKKAQLTPGTIKRQINPKRVDQVIGQTPVAGARVLAGTKVDLVIGASAETVKVPDVVGLKLQQAEEKIARRNLSLGSVTQRIADKAGIVLAQEPLADTEVEINTAVNLVVGKQEPISKDQIVDWIGNDDAFSEIGASLEKLQKWFDVHGIDSMEKIAELKEKSDKEVREDFRLKNLKAVEVFKGILGRLLANE